MSEGKTKQVWNVQTLSFVTESLDHTGSGGFSVSLLVLYPTSVQIQASILKAYVVLEPISLVRAITTRGSRLTN